MKIFARILGLFLMSGLGSFCSIALHSEKSHFGLANLKIIEIKAEELATLDKVIILDAREGGEFIKEHIPGALHLGGQNWDTELAGFLSIWEPSLPVVIYCNGGSCGVSKTTARRLLQDLPDAKIHVLIGGFSAWKTDQTSAPLRK